MGARFLAKNWRRFPMRLKRWTRSIETSTGSKIPRSSPRTRRQKCLSSPDLAPGRAFFILKRIEIWLSAHEGKDILVTSFVRKLVADLQADVRSKIPEEHQGTITISTLHRSASKRRVSEKSHGNSQRRFQPYLKIVGPSWKQIVWADVLTFPSKPTSERLSLGCC